MHSNDKTRQSGQTRYTAPIAYNRNPGNTHEKGVSGEEAEKKKVSVC